MTTISAANLMNCGKVRRYHTVPDEGRGQTTAEHSWGVAVLIATYHPSPSPNLLKAALFHDLAEVYTGDVPATAKWHWTGLKSSIEYIEKIVNEHHGWDTELTVLEKQWLQACDMVELVMYARHRAGPALQNRRYPTKVDKYPGGQSWAEIAWRGVEYITAMSKRGEFPNELEGVL